MTRDTNTLLVSFDETNGKDKEVMLVGRRDREEPNKIEVLNCFQGSHARAIYEHRTTPAEGFLNEK